MEWLEHFFVRWLILVIVFGGTGLGAIYLATGRAPHVRAWLLATPNRIAGVGFAVFLLVWIAIALFNNLSRH